MYDSDIKKRNNIITFIVSLVLTCAAAAVLILKFDFVLSSNDDLMLRSIASGNYTGTPDTHLIYIMYPLGLLFKGLYSLFPSVSWYEGFMCVVHFGCIFLITYRPARVFERLSNKLAALLVSFSVIMLIDCRFIVTHQYTVLAGVCAAAGILWAATYNFKTHNRVSSALIIILFMLSLWLRRQVFFLSLPLLISGLLFRVFERNETSNERFDRLKDALAPALIFLGLVVASFATEYFAYSSPEWKAFKAYNEARTEVYDYNKLPDYYDYPEFYGNLGIDENEYSLLREYDPTLVENVKTEEFNALANKADEIKKGYEQFYSVPRKVILDTVSAVLAKNLTMSGIALTVAFFSIFIFLLLKDEKLASLILCAAFIYEWVFTGYFTYLERLPERVTHGFYLMELSLIASIFLIVIKKERFTPHSSFWQILVTLFLLGVISVMGLYSTRKMMDENAVAVENAKDWFEINAYFKSNPDNVYVISTNVYSTASAVMFNEKASEAFNLIKAGNWTLESPLEKKHEERLIARSLREALLKDDNVYFVSISNESLEEWLVNCFGQATFKDEFITGNGNSYSVYSLK